MAHGKSMQSYLIFMAVRVIGKAQFVNCMHLWYSSGNFRGWVRVMDSKGFQEWSAATS